MHQNFAVTLIDEVIFNIYEQKSYASNCFDARIFLSRDVIDIASSLSSKITVLSLVF